MNMANHHEAGYRLITPTGSSCVGLKEAPVVMKTSSWFEVLALLVISIMSVAAAALGHL
jgi:hypothetical protein